MPSPVLLRPTFCPPALRRWAACAVLAMPGLPAFAALFDDVAARAGRLAQAPFQARADVAPVSGSGGVRFRPDRALWRHDDLPFEVQFFPPDSLHAAPVKIAVVDASGTAHPVASDRADFVDGRGAAPAHAQADGYAGLRVHAAINRPDSKDEFLVFLGASYFRAVGKDQRYGLSGRGLAVDTTGAGTEEFPRFTQFWLEKPAAGATTMTVTALLESKSVTGAYRFVVTPGAETVMDVKSRLYLRPGVVTLGIAPLTSMFLAGENQPRPGGPAAEVHDSDGLMIETGAGEWLWRPLGDPARPFATSFAMPSIKGFGLMQRDRDRADYSDEQARYDLRPSAWVTPVGDWGAGRVELLQLPTADDTNDNIVAYWVPEKLPAPGRPLDIAYRIRWQGVEQQHPPGAWATQSRAVDTGASERQMVVDFAGPSLASLPADAQVKAVVTTPTNADILATEVHRNEATGSWRLALRFKPRKADEAIELRAFLQHDNDILSETWTHVIPPL